MTATERTNGGRSFNISRCKIMHVGKNNPRYEYTMRGVKLRVTEEERDIGVVITKNLKPSEQCSKAAGRATSVLNQLKRNFHYRLNCVSITSNHT